jgi:hypothetical protein
VSCIVLGDHQATTRVFVEAMDDARAGHAADSAELSRAMMQQRVDKRVFFVAGGRVHHQTGWLVQHH